MTVHPLRRPATRTRVPRDQAVSALPAVLPIPAQRSAAALPALPDPTPRSVSMAVLDALGAPAPDRQGPPAAWVPATLLLSLAGRCACADCVTEYTDDVRRSRLHPVSA